MSGKNASEVKSGAADGKNPRTASPQRGNQQPAGLPGDDGVPATLRYAGIVVGLLLITAGIALLVAGKPSILSSLMTCVGFGIVLASFGSKAAGSWAGWTATGAGAIAVILFLILQHYTPAPPSMQIKRGQIRGDFARIADIRIIDEGPMYEFRDPTTASLRFIILDKSLKSQRMSVQIDTTEKGSGREFFELMGSSQEIVKRYLSSPDFDRNVIQWTFDYEKRIIKDGSTVIFAEIDQLDENMLPRRHALLPSWLALTSAANAQGVSIAIEHADDMSRSIEAAIPLLSSDEPATRRYARDVLSGAGTASIPSMMAALRSNSSDYRLKGGVIFVLSAVLDRSLGSRAAISSALKDEDFPILVSAASDDDKTIRFQAAAFLSQLGDPRSIPYSVDAARGTHDNNRAYNQTIILQRSLENVPSNQQDAVRNSIRNDLLMGPGPNNDLVGRNGFTCRTLFGGC